MIGDYKGNREHSVMTAGSFKNVLGKGWEFLEHEQSLCLLPVTYVFMLIVKRNKTFYLLKHIYFSEKRGNIFLKEIHCFLT